MRGKKRLATATAAVVLGLSGALVNAPSAGAAEAPDGPSVKGACWPDQDFPLLCGRLTNRSEHDATYTLDLRAKNDNCTVWNWDGGAEENRQKATCGNPTKLDTGEEAGGPWSRKDVDAFTYNTRYWVEWDGGNLQFPVKAGTWTKIQTHEWAWCRDKDGIVLCTIYA